MARMTRIRFLSAAAMVLAAGVAAARTNPAIPTFIQAAVADPSRPQDARATDDLRKPAETLAFSGVRPGMVVGEFYPSGGYFTRMLSDVVGPSGHVYGMENKGWSGNFEIDQKIIKELRYKNVSFDNQRFGTVQFPQKLDLAWVSQNYHDLKVPEFGPVDTLAFDRAVYAALKPGGIFFILDHQGPAGMTSSDFAKLHRIDRALVIKEVASAGFRLVAQGDFLRRPDDNHQLPIFDKAVKGHTDQFALKFVKPRA